jgi:hypothetical protein
MMGVEVVSRLSCGGCWRVLDGERLGVGTYVDGLGSCVLPTADFVAARHAEIEFLERWPSAVT